MDFMDVAIGVSMGMNWANGMPGGGGGISSPRQATHSAIAYLLVVVICGIALLLCNDDVAFDWICAHDSLFMGLFIGAATIISLTVVLIVRFRK